MLKSLKSSSLLKSSFSTILILSQTNLLLSHTFRPTSTIFLIRPSFHPTISLLRKFSKSYHRQGSQSREKECTSKKVSRAWKQLHQLGFKAHLTTATLRTSKSESKASMCPSMPSSSKASQISQGELSDMTLNTLLKWWAVLCNSTSCLPKLGAPS